MECLWVERWTVPFNEMKPIWMEHSIFKWTKIISPLPQSFFFFVLHTRDTKVYLGGKTNNQIMYQNVFRHHQRGTCFTSIQLYNTQSSILVARLFIEPWYTHWQAVSKGTNNQLSKLGLKWRLSMTCQFWVRQSITTKVWPTLWQGSLQF